MTVEEAWEPPERPWFRIGYTSIRQEVEVRIYALEQGFETLRGFWKWMESRGWDYYDIIRISCRGE